MPETPLDSVKDILSPTIVSWLPYGILIAAALFGMWIAWRLFRQRKQVEMPLPENLTVEVESLTDSGPPPGSPVLEYYNLPVRLAAVVLAPAGRVSDLPPDAEIASLLDAILPGLDKVAALHQPLVRRWPSQVSASGFAHIFFKNAKLPGEAGKGTPWSSVAGIFRFKNQSAMAGLVLRAAQPSSFGQTIVDSEAKWLGCLRVQWR